MIHARKVWGGTKPLLPIILSATILDHFCFKTTQSSDHPIISLMVSLAAVSGIR